MAIEQLVGHFEAVEDPRCSGKVEHRLVDILVIAVCAVIACAESWPEVERGRLERMIQAGRAVERAAWARLTDADLQWLLDTCPGGAEAEEAVVAGGPAVEGDRAPDHGLDFSL
jgi:DDE_Tnp_1-associated